MNRELRITFLVFLVILLTGCEGAQSRSSTLFLPAIADGISFTVTGYSDNRAVQDGSDEVSNGPVTFHIRIRNIFFL